MKGSGDTFIRTLRHVLMLIRGFTKAYVDDMVCYSSDWHTHLVHLDAYLDTMKQGGFTLGLSKCEFGKPVVTFAEHIVGSRKHSIDPEKVNWAVDKI
jgi:hypothetical protein